MKNTNTKIVKQTFIFFLVGILSFNIGLIHADSFEALSRYESAKNAIKTGYFYLERAQSTGLEVYESCSAMNDALGKLSRSEAAYKNGDFDLAYSLADEAYRLSIDEVAELSALSGQRSFLAEITDSELALLLIKISSLSVVAYFIWARIEKQYVKKIMSMRPEATANEH